MASHPFSDGVLRLAQAAETQRGPALLKAATELFVCEPRHTRTSIAVYEELALQLLRITTAADLVAVAGMLSTCELAPQTVLRALLAKTPEVAGVVLAKSKTLKTVDLLSLIATGTDAHLAHLSARNSLPAEVVEALLRKLPVDALGPLLANHSVVLPTETVSDLIEAARGNPVLATALAGRLHDVDETRLTPLFLNLDGRGRRRVVQALEMLALRDFAAKRPIPRIAAPAADLVDRISRTALLRDNAAMAKLLAEAVALPPLFILRLLSDPGGEPLVLALRAAGFEAPVATRVLLFSGQQDQRNYFELKRLVELFETVSYRSAALLVESWRAEAGSASSPRPPRYVPQTEAGTPVRARPPVVEATRPGEAAPDTGRRERA